MPGAQGPGYRSRTRAGAARTRPYWPVTGPGRWRPGGPEGGSAQAGLRSGGAVRGPGGRVGGDGGDWGCSRCPAESSWQFPVRAGTPAGGWSCGAVTAT